MNITCNAHSADVLLRQTLCIYTYIYIPWQSSLVQSLHVKTYANGNCAMQACHTIFIIIMIRVYIY